MSQRVLTKTLSKRQSDHCWRMFCSGTRSKPVIVSIDTGSSELWVNPDCGNVEVRDLCDTLSRHHPENPTTAKDLKNTFSINYDLGSTTGEYSTDNLAIGGAKITTQQFGVAIFSEYNEYGIMGLG
ncbi:aspartic peptidase domain-containing protein [Halenospora varia]|nr:aspartic peptidase domain-containing protein [Halenospora varia]